MKHKEISIKGFTLKMIYIEGGSFMMGANKTDIYAPSDEQPRHKVTISSFYVLKNQITEGLWNVIMKGEECIKKTEDDHNIVDEVSWNDAQEFIKRLNEFSGYKFRLPSEAEWEFIARGGNLDDNYFINNAGKGRRGLSNKLGVADICIGNVEWCQDTYYPYPDEPQINPVVESTDSKFRVLRGGGFGNNYKNYRVSYRFYDYPDSDFDPCGPSRSFRLILDITPDTFSTNKKISTEALPEDLAFAKIDENGVWYSMDGKKLLKGNRNLEYYEVRDGTEIICDSVWNDEWSIFEDESCKLGEIRLPNSVKYIGNNAFKQCYKLSKINLPENLIYIGSYAFESCPLNILIPSSVNFIGNNPFVGCLSISCNVQPKLYNIEADTIFSLNGTLLISCCSREKYYKVPEKVQILGDGCFKANKNIEQLSLPTSLLEIRDEALAYMLRLKYINITSLSYIIGNPFVCTMVEKIEMQSKSFIIHNNLILDKYSSRLISCLSSNKQIKIPEGVRELSVKCFAYNTSIKELDLPKSLVSIEDEAFKYCEHINIIVNGKIPFISQSAFRKRPYGYNVLSKIILPYEIAHGMEEYYNNVSSHIEGCKVVIQK